MIEEKQVSNDNGTQKKAVKKIFKKPIYADITEDSPGGAVPENGGVVSWINFLPG